ncbi:MAG: response regulator [Oligoflexales bacterium]
MGTILIVEDSETVRSELKIIVEGLDHTAILAPNGAKGYEEWTKNDEICLILSDVYMPVMDGLEMCEQIYNNLGDCKMPSILMITTETNQEMKKKAKGIGISGWILKPFNPEIISQVIFDILKRN